MELFFEKFIHLSTGLALAGSVALQRLCGGGEFPNRECAATDADEISETVDLQ